MFIGLDEENNRVTAEEATKDTAYHCPVCGEPFELRKGNIRMHHFAHWKNHTCTDTWSSDMSDWHLGWQARFPKECLEVVVEKDGIKHRADVLIEEQKLVIEFQHSNLTPEEFKERNDFYTECGYHVVWLFDMSEDFKNNHFILESEGRYYTWKYPWGTFRKAEYPCVNYSSEYFFSPPSDGQNTLAGIHSSKQTFWETVDVFFENNGVIEKLLYYDFDNKQVVTSVTDKSYDFQWSESTFLMWLKKDHQIQTLYAPTCTKCRKKMELRTYSFGGFLWGCQNFGVKDIDCRERVDIGSTPIKVSLDDRCPFCDARLKSTTSNVKCPKCNFTIDIKTK